MRYIFKFPDIGEGLEEGTIVEWHVQKGEIVKMGDSLVTMETDKVVTAIPSPRNGTIAALYGKVGETVHVGSALVEIDIEASEESASEATTEAVEEEGAGVVGTLEVAGNNAILSASKEGVQYPDKEKPSVFKKVLATPVARAMAKEKLIDINLVKGTGPGGRVTKDDILKYREIPGETTPVAQALVEIEPITQIRKTIAKNMLNSKQNAAHMTVFEEAEISELERVRNKYKLIYKEEQIKLTYLSFVIKSVAMALKHHKSLNAEMDTEAGNMIYKKYYNIGIAIDTEKGLVVPVVRNADKLTIKEIAKTIQEIAAKAREGKLTMEDMKDGTFTVTSYGSIGGLFAVPVINYPQAGVLGVGRILKKPIIKEDQIVPGLILPLSLSVDHRIADGGDTARFINTVIAYLSDPVSLLMD